MILQIDHLNERAVDEPLEVVQTHHVIVHVPPHLTRTYESIIIHTIKNHQDKDNSVRNEAGCARV
jgi:hypothetical protein